MSPDEAEQNIPVDDPGRLTGRKFQRAFIDALQSALHCSAHSYAFDRQSGPLFPKST
jgi:hypothetical protein